MGGPLDFKYQLPQLVLGLKTRLCSVKLFAKHQDLLVGISAPCRLNMMMAQFPKEQSASGEFVRQKDAFGIYFQG